MTFEFDFLGSFQGNSISQSVSVPVSGNYTFSFWLASSGATPNGFKAYIGGTKVLDQFNMTNSAWIQYSYPIYLNAGSTTVVFEAFDNPSFWELTVISLIPTT